MPLITPPRLLNKKEHYGALIQYGQVLDDVTGELLPNLRVQWDPVEAIDTSGFHYTGITRTDSNGHFSLLLTTLRAPATFAPTVEGYEVTGWSGGPVRTARPVTTLTGNINSPSITIRVNKIPATMTLTASNTTHGTHESGEWINDTPLVMAPVFPTTAPVPTGARYLYGYENWTKSQIEASGIDWTSGTVSQALDTIARADRYFNIVSIVDGVSGVTTSAVTRHHIRYDSTAPSTAGIAGISGVNDHSIWIKASGVSDGLSGTEVEYKFINVTSGFTSTYASGLQYVEEGLTENTAHRVSIQTRDKAGNEAAVKLSDPKEAAVTLVTDPLPSEVVIGWVTDTTAIGTVKMSARDFTNSSVDSSATRFRVWEGTGIDASTVGKEDSGWIQKNDYLFSNIDPSTTYTWGVTYRNQTTVESSTALIERSLSGQDLTQLQLPEFTHLPTINVPAEKSGAVRWGVRLEQIDLIQTHYKVGGVFKSKPYKSREPIYQVRLDADTFIPQDFNDDEEWIKFFISTDGGNTTHPIDLIGQGDNTILTFNSAMTNSEKNIAKLLGWSFVDLDESPTELTVIIEITRPRDKAFSTPLVYSYDLRVSGISKLHKNPLERGIAPQAKR